MRWIDDPCDDVAELAEAIKRPPVPMIGDIQRAVAEAFGIDPAEMKSQRRARVVARPRQVAMYLAKHLTPRSLPEIGRMFGKRDHTTVIHAVRQIEHLRRTDSEIDGHVRSLLLRFDGATACQ